MRDPCRTLPRAGPVGVAASGAIPGPWHPPIVRHNVPRRHSGSRSTKLALSDGVQSSPPKML